MTSSSKRATTLYTGEDSKITVLGTGFTKEWRKQHGKVVIYIAPEENVPYNAHQVTDTLLRFEEGKDFTIDDDGTFVAPLKVEANTLPSYYTLTEYFPDMTLDKVRYEVGILAEPEAQPQSTVQDIWARKNVVTHHGLSTNDYHFDTFAPKLKYDALKDPTKDQELLIQGQGFVGTDIPGVEGMMYVIREKGTGSPVLVMSEMKRYVHGDDEYETSMEEASLSSISRFPRTRWIRPSSTSLRHGATTVTPARRIRLSSRRWWVLPRSTAAFFWRTRI